MLGNILLVLGASMFIGGLGRDRQWFDRTAASAQSAMLLLAAVALSMPAIFELVAGNGLPLPGDEIVDYPSDVEHLSLAVALVLMATYAAGLLFSLKTHRDLFNPDHGDGASRGRATRAASRGRCASPSSCSRSPASPSA